MGNKRQRRTMKKLFIAVLAGLCGLAVQAQTTGDGMGAAIPADASNTDASVLDIGGVTKNQANLRAGWLDIHPHFDYTVNYDDNIFISPTNRVEDVQHTLSPGVFLGAGDYLAKTESYASLDYTPSIILFQDNSDQDAVDQDVDFQLQYHLQKLTLGLRQGYQSLSGSDIQVGNRVDRDIYPTQVTADYEISEKTSVDAELSQIVSDYKSQYDDTTWKIVAYANYKPSEKIKIGIGPTFGWRDIEANPNQTFQQVNARLIYQATEKLSFRGRAGVNFRQTQGGLDSTSPVFGIGATWTPFDSTTIIIDAYRDEYNSPTLFGQNYYATGFAGRIRQRFFQKVYLGLGGGYENSEYDNTVSTVSATREDNYFYVRPSIDYQVTDWWSVGAFYMYRDNDSTSAPNNFYNNQAGFQTSLSF